jgi:hypothetical protein
VTRPVSTGGRDETCPVSTGGRDETCLVSTGGRDETCPVSTGGRGGGADRHSEARAPVSAGPRGRETHDAIRELRRVSSAPHAVSAQRLPRGAPPLRARGERRRRVMREVGGIMEIDPDRNLGGEAR